MVTPTRIVLVCAIALITAAPASAAELPFTGTWVSRGTVGQVYELEVRNDTYSCPQCDGNGGPYKSIPIDGAEHRVVNPPATVRIRAIGPLGFEVVRKADAGGLSRAIRMVSADGKKFEEL